MILCKNNRCTCQKTCVICKKKFCYLSEPFKTLEENLSFEDIQELNLKLNYVCSNCSSKI